VKLREEAVVSVLQDVKPQEGNIVRYAIDNMIIDGMYFGNLYDDRGFDVLESVEFHEVFVFETGCLERFFAFELLGVIKDGNN
jgi:hypothetical protein